MKSISYSNKNYYRLGENVKITGIVAEYNPFHNGHLYHVEKAREVTDCKYIVAVMSGNFVQRGYPAAFDKFKRAEMALKNGVDLVIELPVMLANSSAEYFSHASVFLLESMGIVDNICFGAENADIEKLKKIADFFINESVEFKNNLKENLGKGMSYPLARKEAFIREFPEMAEVLNMPNNILAIEYLKALKKLNSKIEPVVIKRVVAPYHSIDLDNKIASATAVRAGLMKGLENIENNIPGNIYEIIKSDYENFRQKNIDNLSFLLHYILRTKDIKDVFDINDDLKNRILKISDKHFKITDILKEVKCKNYTMTRLNRAIISIILDIKKEHVTMPQYIRVLGFKKSSSEIFKELEKNAKLPLVINLAKDIEKLENRAKLALEKEIKSTDIYNLLTRNFEEKNYEYRKPIVIV
ncbi:MAG: nucleotidyltransferase [Defluviitaleaceae bacterium]|nr:nucleotidyltransferase [Defluviitaleaceae bacterium]